MRTREFAEKHVRFDKPGSPITGRFRLPLYPFLGKPMDASDDIRIKRMVIYKASSCLGTVLGQIINAKRVACDVGDQIMVCQTDDDAAKFAKTRGKEWMQSVPDVMRLLKSDKYSCTNDLWLFRHKFLIITGPGITSAQSDQVRYVQTDESHLDKYADGILAEFEKRMGSRFSRQATHITTAPAQGKEVDRFFYQGTQEEWHWRCSNCSELIWPLWEDESKKHYNGERVFRWKESQSETEMLESIVAVCPHCQREHTDNDHDRYGLVRDGDYKRMNEAASMQYASFRWSAWGAAHWMPWRDHLAEYLQALRDARLGLFKTHEDFVKKRECRSYSPEIPNLGISIEGRDYQMGEKWEVEESIRIGSIDVQDEGGLHFWAQADEFSRDGSSRRIAYAKLTTWDLCKTFMESHGVHAHNTFVDCGHRSKEVFARCSEWEWYALRSTDDDEFTHFRTISPSEPKVSFTRPYSKTEEQDSQRGRKKLEIVRIERGRKLPFGFCYSRSWSKPVIGSILLMLKGDKSERYYGIAKDFPAEYEAQLHSYILTKTYLKTTGAERRFMKQVRSQDHAFATSSMCIVGAMISGFFPLDFATVEAQSRIDDGEEAA